MKTDDELQQIALAVYNLLKKRGITVGEVETVFSRVIKMKQNMPLAKELYFQRESLPLE